MIKLLIVDDEKQIRLGLEKTIDWASIGIGKVYTAQNAIEGLKQFYLHKPDIVLSDIKMAGMSGIEMFNKIREVNHETKLFLLSGHMNTQYTREAISAGVYEYFLKPVDIDAMTKKIKEAILYINKNVSKKDSVDMRLFLEEDREIGTQTIKSIGLDPLSGEYICFLLKISSKDILARSNTAGNTITSFKNMLRDNQDIFYQELYFTPENVSYVGFLSGITQKNAIVSKFYNVMADFSDDDSELPIIAIAKAKSIGCAYKKAKIAMEYEFFYGPASVIDYDSVAKTQNSNLECIEKNFNVITLDKLENLFSFCSFKQIEEIKNTCVKYIMNKNADTKACIKILSANYLFEIMNILSENESVNKDEKQSRLISAIKEYIKENYTSDISLSDISTATNKNQNYISHVFKKETGQSIVKYINKLRLENAARLLIQTDSSVAEISEKVGYGSYNNFIKNFKEQYGKTPLEYRG